MDLRSPWAVGEEKKGMEGAWCLALFAPEGYNGSMVTVMERARSQNGLSCASVAGAKEIDPTVTYPFFSTSALKTRWPYGEEMYAAYYNEDTYRYTGHERDYDLGLDYMIARHYSYGTGRFMTPDPANSGNLYAYTAGNPLKYSDPSGSLPVQVEAFGPVNVHGVSNPITAFDQFSSSLDIYGSGDTASTLIYQDLLNQITVSGGAYTNDGVSSNSRKVDISKYMFIITNKDLFRQIVDLFHESACGMWPIEAAAWIVELESDKYTLIKWHKDPNGATASWNGHPPENTKAQVHSHPNKNRAGITVSPEPSKENDIKGVANKYNLPVFVLSRHAIWVAIPYSKPRQIVNGEWWKNK